MQYTYRSTKYFMDLNNAGKIVCHDLDIEGNTAEEVQKKIREHVDAQRSNKKASVLFFGDRWQHEHDRYFRGTTTGVFGDHHQVWISWKDEDGDNQREKRHSSSVYLDTPENVAKMDEIVALAKQAKELEEKADQIKGTLTRISK